MPTKISNSNVKNQYCPLTNTPVTTLINPVQAACGHIFDRAGVENCMQTPICPLDKREICHLFPVEFVQDSKIEALKMLQTYFTHRNFCSTAITDRLFERASEITVINIAEKRRNTTLEITAQYKGHPIDQFCSQYLDQPTSHHKQIEITVEFDLNANGKIIATEHDISSLSKIKSEIDR